MNTAEHLSTTKMYVFHSICSQITCQLLLYLTACHIPQALIPYCCIWELSIRCSWAMLREAHFLILELPLPQRFTKRHRPTRATQREPTSCLQEADNKPFVFGFYKRKFCGELPGRSDEAHTQHTHQPLPLPFIHWHRNIKSTKSDMATYIYMCMYKQSGWANCWRHSSNYRSDSD